MGGGVCFPSSHRLLARAALHAPAAVRRAPAPGSRWRRARRARRSRRPKSRRRGRHLCEGGGSTRQGGSSCRIPRARSAPSTDGGSAWPSPRAWFGQSTRSSGRGPKFSGEGARVAVGCPRRIRPSPGGVPGVAAAFDRTVLAHRPRHARRLAGVLLIGLQRAYPLSCGSAAASTCSARVPTCTTHAPADPCSVERCGERSRAPAPPPGSAPRSVPGTHWVTVASTRTSGRRPLRTRVVSWTCRLDQRT